MNKYHYLGQTDKINIKWGTSVFSTMSYPTDEILRRVFDYLGDREVFFPEKPGNVFSNSIVRMKDAFSIISLIDGHLYLQLKKNARFQDVMGHLEGCPVEGSGVAAKSIFDEDDVYEVIDNVPVPVVWIRLY